MVEIALNSEITRFGERGLVTRSKGPVLVMEGVNGALRNSIF